MIQEYVEGNASRSESQRLDLAGSRYALVAGNAKGSRGVVCEAVHN
jgi:hypothetical protein